MNSTVNDSGLIAATSNEIQAILDDGEEVRWSARPSKLPYIASHFNPLLMLIGLIFFGAGFFTGAAAGVAITGSKLGVFGFLLVPHFWIGLGALVGPPLYGILTYRRTFYALTTKRAIIQKGLIGTDFEFVDFDMIKSNEVNVGIYDKLFGGKSGSIKIFDGTTGSKGRVKPKTFKNIFDPYEVFKLLKSTSHDVKTDIEYPNALRPDTNPGYNTKLK